MFEDGAGGDGAGESSAEELGELRGGDAAAGALGDQVVLVELLAGVQVAGGDEALARNAANVLFDVQHAFAAGAAELFGEADAGDVFGELVGIGAGAVIRAEGVAVVGEMFFNDPRAG